MILHLNHKKLEIYIAASDLLLECYRLASTLPGDERYNLAQQIKRAALSVKLNISEGASRKSSAERKRFFEVARGSVIEIDAAIEVCATFGYLENFDTSNLADAVVRCFKMLSNLVKKGT